MKYSIRGTLNTSDGSAVVSLINQYVLWRLVTNQSDTFTFEAWVNTEADKNSLFAALKTHVDTNTGSIDWHQCTHDEPQPQPCSIAETYTK
jgi:hypothetical protein